jgi:hypothetical protein
MSSSSRYGDGTLRVTHRRTTIAVRLSLHLTDSDSSISQVNPTRSMTKFTGGARMVTQSPRPEVLCDITADLVEIGFLIDSDEQSEFEMFVDFYTVFFLLSATF